MQHLLHPEGTSKNSDNCDFLKVSDIVKSIVVNGEKYFLNDTAQFREDPMEIEKFANIGTSELCWDISGLFLDDRDISGFLLILLSSTWLGTFYNGVSMAQKSKNISVIQKQSRNVSM